MSPSAFAAASNTAPGPPWPKPGAKPGPPPRKPWRSKPGPGWPPPSTSPLSARRCLIASACSCVSRPALTAASSWSSSAFAERVAQLARARPRGAWPRRRAPPARVAWRRRCAVVATATPVPAAATTPAAARAAMRLRLHAAGSRARIRAVEEVRRAAAVASGGVVPPHGHRTHRDPDPVRRRRRQRVPAARRPADARGRRPADGGGRGVPRRRARRARRRGRGPRAARPHAPARRPRRARRASCRTARAPRSRRRRGWRAYLADIERSLRGRRRLRGRAAAPPRRRGAHDRGAQRGRARLPRLHRRASRSTQVARARRRARRRRPHVDDRRASGPLAHRHRARAPTGSCSPATTCWRRSPPTRSRTSRSAPPIPPRLAASLATGRGRC